MAIDTVSDSARWIYQSRYMQAAIVCMAALSLLAGVVQAIVLKWQNRTRVVECTAVRDKWFEWGHESFTDCKTRHFTQAFLQTLFMFGGECIALPFYFLVERRFGRKQIRDQISVSDDETQEGNNTHASNIQSTEELSSPESKGSLWWWTTPAPLDFAECALGCIAVTITYTSTVQMLHNFMVISSAVFTMLILHRPLRVHEWAGCVVVTAALVLSSIPALTKPEMATESHSSMHWLGILLAVVSTCIHSLQNIWEEALFRKSNISATYAVGLEGVTGFLMAAAALPLVELTGYERPSQGWRQMRYSPTLKWGMAMYAVASLLNNVCGIAVTKWTSGLLRCLFMSIRAPMIWIIEMYFRWNGFDWCNFASMFVLSIGLALYMFVYPFSCIQDKPRNILMLPITFGVLHEEGPETSEMELVNSEEKYPRAGTPATGTPSII